MDIAGPKTVDNFEIVVAVGAALQLGTVPISNFRVVVVVLAALEKDHVIDHC